MRILILTTNRADYHKLEKIIDFFYNSKKYKLYLIVSGCHLLTDYGMTWKDIKYPIYKKINTFINVEDEKFMPESVAFSMTKYPSLLEEIKPDKVILHGDRFDIISMAFSCLLMNIKIIHIEGGENTSCVDDKIRNSVTQIATYNLVSNSFAFNKLLSMGIDKEKIFITGCPIIDKIKKFNNDRENWENIKNKINLTENIKNNYIVCCFHIDTVSVRKSIEDFLIILKTLKKIDKTNIIFYPNIDTCDKKLIRYLDNICKDKNFIPIKSLNFVDYFSLIYNSGITIGNSSSIVRELPCTGKSHILLGSRQKGRYLSKNTIFLEDFTELELEDKIIKNFNIETEKDFIYGEGNFIKNLIKYENDIFAE